MKKYEVYPREYSILSISSVYNELIGQAALDNFGTTFSEILVVIKDGKYYYVVPEGEKEELAKGFLQKVNKGEIDTKKMFAKFVKNLKDYFKLIETPPTKYNIDLIRKFFDYYNYFIILAYIGAYCLDYIDTVKPDKKSAASKLITEIRHKAEPVFKYAEVRFLPKFLTWFAKKHTPKYSADLLRYVVWDEFFAFLDKKKPLPSVKVLKDRSKLCLMRHYPLAKYSLITGALANKQIKAKRIFDIKQLDSKDHFPGQAAFKGKTSGRVKIVLSSKNLNKVKEGDILVSVMTDPNYLPAMKKAAGFITDEGGVLCHAAIVAREMKKPCLIGTKIATQVLKDGDMVELDADAGRVIIFR